MNPQKSKHGFFDEDGNYVVTTPRLPVAWWNYCFNDTTYLEFSQTGQGDSLIRLPKVRRWNRRWRYVYVKDRATGEAWCPTWAPLCRDIDDYRCTHAPAWSRIDAVRGGTAASLRAFVPREGLHEVWTLGIANKGSERSELDVFIVFSFDIIPHMGCRCAWEEERELIGKYAFPHHGVYDDYFRYKDLPNYNFVAPTASPDSYACGEEDFFGCDAAGAVPDAVAAGRCPSRSIVPQAPVAAFHYGLVLEPGAEWRGHFVAGCAYDADDARSCRELYAEPESVERELAAVEAQWQDTEKRLKISTPDPDLDRAVNRWLKKEIVWMSRMWRNCITAPGRNALQDAMGYACFDPASALPYLREVTAMQRGDGYLKVWNTRPGEAPDHPMADMVHSDGGAWLVLCWCAAVEQAGAPELLDAELPFADGGNGTLLRHLVLATEYTASQTGRHGLVLMRDGDWTDPINGPGRLGRGESVWTTMAMAYACRRLAALAALGSDGAETARALNQRADALIEAVNTHAWTGEWYAYGFDDEGVMFGAPADGHTYLNVQTWAIISGAAEGERLAKVLAVLEGMSTLCGMVLIDPPYSGWNPGIGRVSIKIGGTTENGSVYCHGSAFAAYAMALLGDGDRCYDIVRRTLPTNPDNPPELSGQAPIWQPNCYYGLRGSDQFGKSSRIIGTGTCTWILYTVVDYMLGVRATVDGLTIRPSLPRAWERARVERTFRDCRYVVDLVRDLPAGSEISVEVDGERWSKEFLPVRGGGNCSVTVHLPRING